MLTAPLASRSTRSVVPPGAVALASVAGAGSAGAGSADAAGAAGVTGSGWPEPEQEADRASVAVRTRVSMRMAREPTARSATTKRQTRRTKAPLPVLDGG